MKPDGGPAFPGASDKELGMSLRDYFAAKALPVAHERLNASEQPYTFLRLVERAYMIADAMLRQRLL
jgi:hypothetical protein